MRIHCLILLAAFAGGAQAAVTVTFSGADQYTDTGGQLNDVRDVTVELERHLQRLGAVHLAPGRSVNIEVLDIDLAGDVRFRPRDATELRVLRGGLDWPSLRVRYFVESSGKAGEAREETVSDLSYLLRPVRRGEWLAYEKRMLETWFRDRFGGKP